MDDGLVLSYPDEMIDLILRFHILRQEIQQAKTIRETDREIDRIGQE